MIGLELRKTFLRLRAVPLLAAAFLPAGLFLIAALAAAGDGRGPQPAAQMALTFANVYQVLFLRLLIFLGCFGIFTYLIRGEIAERSLHFYLMAPLRREVLLVGKYVAGCLAAGLLFTLGVLAQLASAFLPHPEAGGRIYLFEGAGAQQALAYVGITLLAVVGYGALFLALALVFRNPMIPAAVFLGWEWLNFVLPPTLKKISIIHYLESLCPIPISSGPFAIPAESTAPWLAVASVLGIAALLVTLSARRARRLEVLYAED
jgi:ABC-type transport system involved in multi-copper enzyme maturation permease subunit